MGPLRAGARAWREETGVEIEWHARSLRDFGDQPLEELASSCDLLSIDHPFVGTASATGCLAPLDELLPADVLDALAGDAIGPCHDSYTYAGHQWGLATDAACQVSALRRDLLPNGAPTSWKSVLDLARRLPGRVAIALVPADAICSYSTLLANLGAAPPASLSVFAERRHGVAALELLDRLARLGHPACLDMNPPAVLDRMTETDEIVYIPLAFGYTNYSRPGERPHPVAFVDIPSAGAGPVGSILGGAGLAVSATSAAPAAAAEFAAWLTGAEAQRTIVVDAGGQPGSRSAWLDPRVERLTGGFTSGTRTTIEAAYVRPRDPWWPPFQLAAGSRLHELLRERAEAAAIYRELEQIYQACRRRS
jgi:multiple sugar transport system substrate-binding protein